MSILNVGAIGKAGMFGMMLLISAFVFAQSRSNDSVLINATLQNVVQYAIKNSPELKNSRIDQEIIEAQIRNRLADWYPQVSFGYNLQHTFQLPTANINGQLINTGLPNTSGAQFGLTQNIFNRDVLLASRTARDVRMQSQQNTINEQINVAVSVSKAFYDIILTIQQLHVIEEDINRINASLKDAYYQYQGGVRDKTDYKRATIALNNAKAQQKNGEESLKSKYAYLKELMGYPSKSEFDLQYDTTALKNELLIDTTQTVNYGGRIEYKQLQTQKNLLQYNLTYTRWSYLPEISLFANYNLNYQNRSFSKIYSQWYHIADQIHS